MTNEFKNKVLEIVLDILELEPEELTEHLDFVTDYGADSLRKIEIMARLEKELNLTIPQTDLARMNNLKDVFEIVHERIGVIRS